jgi:hypothetical protein
MGNILSKIREMEEDGTLPQFDSTNMGDVLNLAYSKGLRQQIMFDAMDMIRENPNLSNEEAVISSAKKWHVI